MSKMAELYMEIEEQLMNGAKPEEIARAFNVPIKMVHEVEDDLMHVTQDCQGYEYDQMD